MSTPRYKLDRTSLNKTKSDFSYFARSLGVRFHTIHSSPPNKSYRDWLTYLAHLWGSTRVPLSRPRPWEDYWVKTNDRWRYIKWS